MAVRIIKRYSNRKLYDQTVHKWVKLSDIARMVSDGEEVHVFEHTTGEEITDRILADALSRELKSGRSPIELIKKVLFHAGHGFIEFFKSGNEAEFGSTKEEMLIQKIIRRLMGFRGDLNRKIAEEVRKQLEVSEISALQNKIEQLDKRIEHLEDEIEKLRSMLSPKSTSAGSRN